MIAIVNILLNGNDNNDNNDKNKTEHSNDEINKCNEIDGYAEELPFN